MGDRVALTVDQALGMIRDGDTVHVFLNPGIGMLLGADWDRADVVALIRAGASELSGPNARSLGHEVSTFADGRWHFIATKDGA